MEPNNLVWNYVGALLSLADCPSAGAVDGRLVARLAAGRLVTVAAAGGA